MKDSVLVGFTPTHLIIMLELARKLPGRVWLFHPDAQRIPLRSREGLTFLGRCEHPGRSRVHKYASTGLSLRRLLRKGRDATVCVPHPFNPLSNFAFFAPGARDVRIYQDGILNYYDAANPFVRASVLAKRRLLASGALLPYRPYVGHLSGIEEREISTGYFTHPEHVVLYERFSRIAQLEFGASLVPGDQPKSGEPVTLFLDQPIERLVSREAVPTLRRLASDFADSMGRPVLYKPHYTQRAPFETRRGWQVASPEEMALPAEEIPVIRPVDAVVSFCSSALVNIRLSRPNMRCAAIGGALIPIRIGGQQRTMADLFANLGVQVVDFEGAT